MVEKHQNQPKSPLFSSAWVLLLNISLLVISILVGCTPEDLPTTPNLPVVPPTSLPNQGSPVQTGISATPAPLVPTALPTPQPHHVWWPPYLPGELVNAIVFPDGYEQASTPDEADIILDLGGKEDAPDSQWVYALVAPFPTLTDGVTLEDLQNVWNGGQVPVFNGSPLLMDSNTKELLTAFWGPPASSAVQVFAQEQLSEYAWSNRPSWAIVPFEELDPGWKTLAIDGQSPVHKDFNPTGYPLTIPLVITTTENVDSTALVLPASNRDAARLTTVAMTGVTAMVRATAYTMENLGITYPAVDIGPTLAEADITHISNEIPFYPDCPFPGLTSDNLVFCSSPEYIDLLKAVGTDIIELTGDHFMDYGAEATLYTLDMYNNLGWPYFGGGANAEEARQPVLLENNGNKIAFIGCNIGCQVKSAIPCNAIATDTHPGAAQCDFEWLGNEIPALREQGYQVIFTFQHREYYTYAAEPILVEDFGRVASYGATIVSGSQAHQPHGFSFDNGAFIHYGLGNLFFDQFHFCADYACDDAFIDRHVFYDGRHISTELITIRFIDLARPRLMTPEERVHFLEIIFAASGW